ncbi:uncharacterized protein [Phaseolus vulgaris]|uniref:uncharacterized protein n=1 Tax=Phaseolus vulgaris TaxID=3885 RepID=UPI0035CC8C1C
MESTSPTSKRVKTRAVRTGGRLESWFSGDTELTEKYSQKLDKVRRLLKDQSLRKFLELKGNIYPDFVRVFYTNLKFQGNNLVSHVKGVEMEITHEVWAAVAGLKFSGLRINRGNLGVVEDFNKIQFYKNCLKNNQSQHCNKLGHPPFKCWRRPDAKCNKCNQLGHEVVICRNQSEQQELNQSEQQDVDAQIANEEDVLFVATGFSNNISSASWLIDSGCTNHMTYDKKHFKKLKPSKISKVKIGHGGHISVKGIGTNVVATHLGTKTITNVLYVPNIDQNLLSVGQLLQKGFKVFFEDNHCLIKDTTGQDLFKVQMRGKSFSLDLFQEELTGQGLLKMQKSEMKDDPLIKGNRLLSDIYHRVVVCESANHKEPADHKEVINDPKSKKAMEEVYMIEKNKTQEQPKGKEDKVYKLSKAIYGLKDIPRTWYNRIDDDYLISFGFDKSLLESAPYVKSKGVEWRLSKARMKRRIFADLFSKPPPANKFEFSRQKNGICSSKNQGGVLDIVFFNCK